MKRIKKLIIISLLILPIYAAGPDDEIIKNLDFFQNMELLKDDNPYLIQPKIAKDEKSAGAAEEGDKNNE
jgi:hypothetical protein